MKLLFVVQKFTRTMGASEDLITAAAVRLAESSLPPAFWFNFAPPEDDARIRMLRANRCEIHSPPGRTFATKVRDKLLPTERSLPDLSGLEETIRERSPDLIVVNQGGNSDAWAEMLLLRKLGTPFVVLCHAAAEWTWPDGSFAAALHEGYSGAKLVCFVSRENRELTESQIGSALPRTQVVRNPCKFSEPVEAPWPEESGGLHLACVARLDARMKGQDLILHALSRPHWKDRDLSITFYGDGPDRASLESLAASMGVTRKVKFAGHVSDIPAIWRTHHGFIQCSRYEGFGLSLLEACFSGRMVVATPFPAAREFVIDGESGFIATNPSPDAVDAALDRAWSARESWREMGRKALDVAGTYPRDPVGDFIATLSEQAGAVETSN